MDLSPRFDSSQGYRWSSVPSGAYDMMVEAEATPVKRKVVKYEPGQKTYSQDSTLFAGL